MKTKKIVIFIVILIIALIGSAIYLGVTSMKKSKYTKADEYSVGGVSFPSVKKVVEEKKVTKYHYEKTNYELLELTFKDSDNQNTVEKYIGYIKDNGNYIDEKTEDEKVRKIIGTADEGLITVETKLISDGFVLTIAVGEGNVQINPME